MSIFARLKRIGIDTYLLLLLGMVLLGSVLPASGDFAAVVRTVSLLAVALLFFLYGARLDTSTVVAGLANWRLQGLTFVTTFAFFPLLALGLSLLISGFVDPAIATGILFLGALPSTVQSSIALTGLARGNVAAAVCAASLSNLVGVVLTPLLCSLLLGAKGSIDPAAIGSVALQILLPFVLGQLARPLIGAWVKRHRLVTLSVDRGSILLIVYSAFSAGMVSGVWTQVGVLPLLLTLGAAAAMFFIAVAFTGWTGRLVGLPEADRTTLLFCGSTKSLASGVPIATILFAGQAVSLIILPVMLYHQFQLIACAIIAQRQATRLADAETPVLAGT
jgi:solute carrier family 10 (sodium/bile acid cotransporter), member 7